MRVNFAGSFGDIQRLFTQASPRSVDQEEFGALLGGMKPGPTEPVATVIEEGESPRQEKIASTPEKPVEQQHVPVAPSFEKFEPMARFHAPDPELQIPTVEFMTPKETPGEGMPSTPTVISVRRVPEADQFSEMRKGERIAAVRSLVDEAGNRHGIDPSLGMAVISVESSFNSDAVSKDGFNTKGLFQLKDTTGTQVLGRIGGTDAYDPFNPKQNVDVGVGYLRYLHDLFVSETALPNDSKTVAAANSSSLEKLAVAAFNAGEGRIASAQQRALKAGLDPSRFEDVEEFLPESTQAYVRKVMSNKNTFELDPAG